MYPHIPWLFYWYIIIPYAPYDSIADRYILSVMKSWNMYEKANHMNARYSLQEKYKMTVVYIHQDIIYLYNRCVHCVSFLYILTTLYQEHWKEQGGIILPTWKSWPGHHNIFPNGTTHICWYYFLYSLAFRCYCCLHLWLTWLG